MCYSIEEESELWDTKRMYEYKKSHGLLSSSISPTKLNKVTEKTSAQSSFPRESSAPSKNPKKSLKEDGQPGPEAPALDKLVVVLFVDDSPKSAEAGLTFNALSNKFSERATFVKADAITNLAAVRQLRLGPLPAAVLYRGSEEVARVRRPDLGGLERVIEEHVAVAERKEKARMT